MPTVQVTTKTATQVWKSPDGQRTINEVELDWEGKTLKAKTYSDAIATVGWSGEVESYEKQGRNGNETFVKQPPKENPGYGSTSGGSARSSSGYTPRDDSHIRAQWAIGQANSFFTMENLDTAVVEQMATDFFLMVDRVKQAVPDGTPAPTPEAPAEESEAMQALLKDAEPVDEQELPWPNS